MKNEAAIEEIRSAVKRIEKESALKTILFVGIGIAAAFAALMVLIIKIRDRYNRKMIFGTYDGYDYDDYDEFNYEDYEDDNYDDTFSVFDSLDDETDDEYNPYDLNNE